MSPHSHTTGGGGPGGAGGVLTAIQQVGAGQGGQWESSQPYNRWGMGGGYQ